MVDRNRVPTYRLHKQSGQAIVTVPDSLGGRRDVLLGEYATKESRLEYARVIAEWEANGRRLLRFLRREGGPTVAKKNKKKKPPTPARFAAGAQVRVKPGTTDPDFPDIPLGGWAGIIREVDPRSAPPTYLIAWNRHTLDHMHPVYRKRCERDGLELESMWLGEDDIEPDPGGPAVLEQPTRIITRPLNDKDQDDRVRIALGLTSDDPLPEVEEGTLRAYHRYLAAHLKFPFEAKWEPEYGPVQTIKITGMGDPEEDAWADETYGLLGEARVEGRLSEVPLGECEAKKGSPNRQLLKDYAYWFWNNR